MKSFSHVLLITVCVLLVPGFERVSCAQRPSDWIPETPAEFLKKLRFKDAQFDNLTATQKRHQTLTRNPLMEYVEAAADARQLGKEPPEKPTDLKSYKVKTTNVYTLTIRGKQTTVDFTSDFDGRGRKLEDPYHSKSSNRTGHLESYSEIADRRLLHISEGPPDPVGLLYEARMEIEFCCGVGYGSRLIEIDSVTPQGRLAVVEGTMKLWTKDVTKATLTVDRNFIVRKAVLLAKTGGGETRFEVTTEGTVDAGKYRNCAAKATYLRTALSAMVDGKKKVLNHIRDSYSTSDHSIEADLTPAAYEERVLIDHSQATDIIRIP